jgi:hypothetical protein
MVHAYIDLGNRDAYYAYLNFKVSVVSVPHVLIIITFYS